MKVAKIQLTMVVSAPFEENTFIARLEGRNDCIVVDPGLEPDKIIAVLEENQLTPDAILNTHGHGDHIGGNQALKQRWPAARLVIGRAEAPKLLDPELNLSSMFGVGQISPPADELVDDNDILSVAGVELEVLAIPGHSAGHVAYLWKGGEPNMVFVGDIIFQGSIGRTDFPDGNFGQLEAGIRAKLYTLPDSTVLLPGHGGPTTVGREKRSNPFVSG